MHDLQELYQQVIIDHGMHPRNVGELQPCSHHAQGFNPLCGDQLKLYLNVKNEEISEIKFMSNGCAISTASASLMSQFIQGKTITQARQTMQNFTSMLTNTQAQPSPSLEKLTILAGVRDYPARVKCATLAWHTLVAALDNVTVAATTE